MEIIQPTQSFRPAPLGAECLQKASVKFSLAPSASDICRSLTELKAQWSNAIYKDVAPTVLVFLLPKGIALLETGAR